LEAKYSDFLNIYFTFAANMQNKSAHIDSVSNIRRVRRCAWGGSF